jgi:molecular chaperone Hsp33
MCGRRASPGGSDELVRTLSDAGGIAVRALVGTELVSEATRRHGTAPTASAVLGRTLMGAVLLAAGGKHGETVQVQLRGDGPAGTVLAIADERGRVRGTVANPAAHPPHPDGQLDVQGAVGRGVLTVVRHREGRSQPYSGIVPLVSGSVAKDLTHYLAESEQTRSATGLGVFLAPEGSVESAAGFLVQALPDAGEDEVARAEANVEALPGPGELVRDGVDADGLVDRLLDGLGSRHRQRDRPVFHCGCGLDRVLRAVAMLGREELEEAAAGDAPLEVRCRFCAETYRVSPRELQSLLRDA